MKRTIESRGQKLFCSAPGDGTLRLAWTINEYPYNASGRPVLLSEAKRYLNLKHNQEKYRDWTIHQNANGYIKFVKKDSIEAEEMKKVN